MASLHKLLKKQIEQAFGSVESVPKKYNKLLDSINESYIKLEKEKTDAQNLLNK